MAMSSATSSTPISPLSFSSSTPSQATRARAVPSNRAHIASTSISPTPAPPLSALSAFLAALSWTRARRDDFDAGINASNAWTKERASVVASGSGAGAGASTNADAGNVLTASPERMPADTMNALSDDESDVDVDAVSNLSLLHSPVLGGAPALSSEPGRLARALYAFDGKPEFRELTSVCAGDRLEVVKEDIGGGWSLVRQFVRVGSENGEREAVEEGRIPKGRGEGKMRGEVGLLPCTYYTYTADFVHSGSLATHAEEPSDSTPRASPTRQLEEREEEVAKEERPGEPDVHPIVPQTTGEWFPSFRRSLLGGKQLNRFSSFVTSGAEAWVLRGDSDASGETHAANATSSEDYGYGHGHRHDRTSSASSEGGVDVVAERGEADTHFVEASGAGPAWRTKLPPFRIFVHSPSRRSSMLSGAYTMYAVTSLFDASPPSPSSSPSSHDRVPSPTTPVRITVHRRFSHFVALHTALTRRLPGIALPPLPEKQYAGRFNDDFVEARRGDLERYLARVVRHPVARYAEVLTFFLGCESEVEWKRGYPRYLALPPTGPSFYAHVFHPAFNVDAEEASEAVDRFAHHMRAVSKGVQALRGTFTKVRETSVEMCKAQRLLAYSLLSLITSKSLASTASIGTIAEEEDDDADGDGGSGGKRKGHMNEDGAWCWREGCEDCLKLTKAMHKTSEALHSVADLYDDHARRTQLITHEGLKSMAHPSTVYAGVVETHRSTLVRYNEATQAGFEDEDIAARCETVLNTTMAEFETYHAQKVEDFHGLATEILDGEIELYEQILARLKAARQTFSPHVYDTLAQTTRQPSIYERELAHPRLAPPPLPQPCPHVYDSAPMRPVSVAIQEGVGILLSPTRASVFGKFW